MSECQRHVWYSDLAFPSRVMRADWCVVPGCGELHPDFDPRLKDEEAHAEDAAPVQGL